MQQLDLIRDTALVLDPRLVIHSQVSAAPALNRRLRDALAPDGVPLPWLQSSRGLSNAQRNEVAAGSLATPVGAMVSPALLGFLALVCLRRGLCFVDVSRQLARKGTLTLDPEWVAASRARDAALYLTNTLCNVPQATLARATGLSRPAVHFAICRVEDGRDDPQFDAELRSVVRMTAGRDE